jgi:hypothetical protein
VEVIGSNLKRWNMYIFVKSEKNSLLTNKNLVSYTNLIFDLTVNLKID